jgi:uncharacterized protein
MKEIIPPNKVIIAQSLINKAGRGVFAAQDIEEQEIIESCPVIEMSLEDSHRLKETQLKNYYFMWGPGEEKERVAICLGFGSMYNHSYKPNATYSKKLADHVIEFVAIKPIKKGEEVTVNYNYGKPEDKSTLWIKEIDPYKKL